MLFVECRNGSVLIFDSIDDAQRRLESPDVEAGEYIKAFDEKGKVFSVEVTRPTKKRSICGFGVISLAPVRIQGTEVSAPGELMRALRKHLGIAEEQHLSLEQLIARVTTSFHTS